MLCFQGFHVRGLNKSTELTASPRGPQGLGQAADSAAQTFERRASRKLHDVRQFVDQGVCAAAAPIGRKIP